MLGKKVKSLSTCWNCKGTRYASANRTPTLRLIPKWYNTVEDVAEYNYIGKPMTFSEYGPGDGTAICDNGSDFYKTVLLTPFTGIAGSAMNWEWQYPGEEFYWPVFGPVNTLMEGIKLDEENWQAGEPDTYNDNKVEMLYLFSEEDDNNQRKAVGAISNRTYNYYTQAPDGSLCKQSLPSAEYVEPENFLNSEMQDEIELNNMGANKQYHVEWFNALTGEFLLLQEYPSGLLGNLELSFPELLTGNETSPIMFFTVHPAGGSLKLAEENSTDHDDMICQNLSIDSTIADIKPTNWNYTVDEREDLAIIISPNPTRDLLNISIEFSNIENYNWYLISENGSVLIKNTLINRNFVLDLSSFESGTYYFILENMSNKVITKIVKI